MQPSNNPFMRIIRQRRVGMRGSTLVESVQTRAMRGKEKEGLNAMCRGAIKAALVAATVTGCAGPFNQVTPCIINCAVTLQGSPATAPQPAHVQEVRVRP